MRITHAAAALAALFTLPACVHKPTMHLDHAEISGVQLATMPTWVRVSLRADVAGLYGVFC